MNSDDREFIEEAAKRLDATFEQLEAEEIRLLGIVGDERANELRAFWLSEFDEVDMEERPRIRRSSSRTRPASGGSRPTARSRSTRLKPLICWARLFRSMTFS